MTRQGRSGREHQELERQLDGRQRPRPAHRRDLGVGQRLEVANGVDMTLTLLGAGMSGEDILSDYDDLEADGSRAALVFAARLSRFKPVRAVVS